VEKTENIIYKNDFSALILSIEQLEGHLASKSLSLGILVVI